MPRRESAGILQAKRQMTLIVEAARLCRVSRGTTPFEHGPRAFQPGAADISMRRHPKCLTKQRDESADAEPAKRCKLFQLQALVQMLVNVRQRSCHTRIVCVMGQDIDSGLWGACCGFHVHQHTSNRAALHVDVAKPFRIELQNRRGEKQFMLCFTERI